MVPQKLMANWEEPEPNASGERQSGSESDQLFGPLYNFCPIRGEAKYRSGCNGVSVNVKKLYAVGMRLGEMGIPRIRMSEDSLL